MLIRKFQKKDISEVVKLGIDFLNYHKKFDPFFAPSKNIKSIYKKYFSEYLNSNNKLLLVAEEKGKIIGFATGDIKKGSELFRVKVTGLIEYIFVSSGYRRQGMGEVFMKEILAWFKGKKIKYIAISVHSKNKIGRKAWEKYGFKEFMIRQRIS